MIKQTFNNNIFLEIVDKLKEVKDCKLSANTLYAYMLAEDVFTYASYDNKIMNGCLVLKLFKDNEGDTALLMLFVWIDPYYPKLYKDFIGVGNNKAKKEKAVKMYIIANRNEKAIERRTGFKRAWSTYVKEVI